MTTAVDEPVDEPVDDVDVVVVGGGIAGVSAAAGLAAHCRVALLEAEPELARHTTGRSAATFLPSYGGPVGRPLTAASRQGFEELAAEVGRPLLTPRELLWLAYDDESHTALATAVAENPALVPAGPAEIRARCPALRPELPFAAAVDTEGMAIDVAGVHEGYVRRFRRLGGTVAVSAPVSAVDRDGDGWLVKAGDRRWRTRAIVDAAGAWADEVARLAGVRPLGLRPLLRTAFVCPVPDGRDVRGWPIVADTAERFYFEPEGLGLLVSPADETPSPPCDARPDELAVARTLELVNELTDLGLRRVSRAWAGLRSFVADRAPVVGSWPGEPGFVFLAGQGGFGIQTAPALADAAAGLVLSGELPERITATGLTAGALDPARLAR